MQDHVVIRRQCVGRALGGKVELDELGSRLRAERGQLGIVLAAGEIVENVDGSTVGGEGARQAQTDKTRAAGDQYGFHHRPRPIAATLKPACRNDANCWRLSTPLASRITGRSAPLHAARSMARYCLCPTGEDHRVKTTSSG